MNCWRTHTYSEKILVCKLNGKGYLFPPTPQVIFSLGPAEDLPDYVECLPPHTHCVEAPEKREVKQSGISLEKQECPLF